MSISVESSRPQESPQKRTGILVALTGPTAAGKTTILNELLRQYPTMGKIVSTTTRAPRAGEVDGYDFHYVTRQDFCGAQERGEFLEWVEYGGNLYGVQRHELESVLAGEDRILIPNMGRATELKGYYDEVFDPVTAHTLREHTLVLLIGSSSLLGLWRRYKARGQDRDSFLLRMREDWNVWQQSSESFDDIVMNEELALASTVNRVAALIEQKRQVVRAHFNTGC